MLVETAPIDTEFLTILSSTREVIPMSIRSTMAATFALLFVGVAMAADQPAGPPLPKLPPGFSPEAVANRKDAAKAADWLEKEYPAAGRPESIRMLLSILRNGSQM